MLERPAFVLLRDGRKRPINWAKIERIAEETAAAAQAGERRYWRGMSAKRRAAIARATPKWADHAKIDALYDEADAKTAETGIVHHVDHFYPVQGRRVCGLHVHTNLRVITAGENLSKGARMVDDLDAVPIP